jgi:amphi-Trp domain-containing protein
MSDVADFKHKHKDQLSRQAAGERLIALGTALTARADLDLGDQRPVVPVADDLRYEFEVKSKGDRVEIEVELSWARAQSAADAPSAEHEASAPAAGSETPPAQDAG